MDLSVLIPSRNEMFLKQTIQDILGHIEGDTEVIAILDGVWSTPPVPDNPRVTLVYHNQPIGQRASTNEAAKLSEAKFIMKCDAHCAFDQGFDVKLMADCEHDWTVIPRMYNLHAFDWKCKQCGNQTYQGPHPTKCTKCNTEGADNFEICMIWKPRISRKTDFARFDHELHFQYWSGYGRRPEAKGDIADTMCHVGACWFMHRDRYWELGGMDESHGSWGQMGVEVSCKSWLSGGRQVVNKKTWYSHMFRTQPGFGFPYHLSESQVEKARIHSKHLWMDNTWPKAVHPLAWLINKFAPVPEWDDAAIAQVDSAGIEILPQASASKEPATVATPAIPEVTLPTIGVVYYTDNRCDEKILKAAQSQLIRACKDCPIISVSLKPIDFGQNIVLNLERGYITMFKQILEGIKACQTDIIFLAEHDILYHPSHFGFKPVREDVFYYNQNNWKVDAETGKALFYLCHQTLAMCGYRTLLLDHYQKRVDRVEKEGFQRSIGFEPGDHQFPRGIDDKHSDSWMSPFPNIDIRHSKNLTQNRWRQDQFRDPKACLGWKWADEEKGLEGWGKLYGRFDQFLNEVTEGKII